jgi:hypothetical protein
VVVLFASDDFELVVDASVLAEVVEVLMKSSLIAVDEGGSEILFFSMVVLLFGARVPWLVAVFGEEEPNIDDESVFLDG